MASKQGKVIYVDSSGKKHYEMEYAKNVINNNKDYCSGLRRSFKSTNKTKAKPHGISQNIWRKAMSSTGCPRG